MENISNVLAKVAASDMTLARKEGEILIGQTKAGTLALRYDRAAKSYSVTTQGIDSRLLVEGSAGAVRPVLAALYAVE